MKIQELLQEQTHEDLARDALITLLTTQHALGIYSMPVHKLIDSLGRRNYFVDQDWINNQIADIGIVDTQTSTPETIELKQPGGEPSEPTPPPEPEPEEKVTRMAQKALNKRMNKW